MEVLYWLILTALAWWGIANLLKCIIRTANTTNVKSYKRPDYHEQNRYSKQFQKELHRESMERHGNFY